MAISGLDFKSMYAQSNTPSFSQRGSVGQPQNAQEQNIFASSSIGGINNGANASEGIRASQAQANLGLVSRLDSLDNGSLNAPEQRDDQHGRKLYCLG